MLSRVRYNGREPAGMGRVGIRRPDAWSPVLKLYHSLAGDSKAV